MNINKIIVEELQGLNEEQLQQYTIPMLAQTMGVMKHEPASIKIYQKMLFDGFKRGGDQAVIDMYSEISGVEINAIRKGRYVFGNVSAPDNSNKLE